MATKKTAKKKATPAKGEPCIFKECRQRHQDPIQECPSEGGKAARRARKVARVKARRQAEEGAASKPRAPRVVKRGPPEGYMFCPFDCCNEWVPKDDPLSGKCDVAESLRQARERERVAAWDEGHDVGYALAKEALLVKCRLWQAMSIGAMVGAVIIGCVLGWVLACG